MAEEVNAAKVAPSPKSVHAANNGTGGKQKQQQKEEVGPLIRSPNDATPALRADNPNIYQAEVVEGETTTTAKPAEGGAAPDAAASPVAPAADAAAPAADAAAAPAADAAAPAADPAAAPAAAPAEGETAPASPAAADAPAASPVPAEGAAAGGTEGAAAKSPEGGAAPAGAEATAVTGAETTVTTTIGPVTGSPTTKDPYAIDIPLDKKINKRTQRKLWEEIEKRKPLVPKHVAQHIQKYAKPPFETWGCKFRGKGSCSGCK